MPHTSQQEGLCTTHGADRGCAARGHAAPYAMLTGTRNARHNCDVEPCKPLPKSCGEAYEEAARAADVRQGGRRKQIAQARWLHGASCLIATVGNQTHQL